jgi:ubiquitin-protein ligase
MSDSSSRPIPPAQTAPPLLNWSDDQLVRLEYEWRRLQRAFAYHPYVRIVSMRDDPPGEYEIEFTLRTLMVGESGELEYADSAPVRVWLPPSFPYSPPVVRPLTGLFHPNVSWQGVHLSSWWQPTDTLVAFLKKIGELLAWRVYDPDAIVNPLAMDWLEQNPSLLPLDTTADFAAEAGGEPLARICKYGPATIEQIRKQLATITDALRASASPPAATEVSDFCGLTRSALNLFLDDDVPQALRSDAARLEEWARGLPTSLSVFQFLRDQQEVLRSARGACDVLTELPDSMLKQFADLEAIAPTGAPDDASSALETIPDLRTLEPVRLKLPDLVRRAEEQSRQLRPALVSLETRAAQVPLPPDSLLGGQLRRELDACAADARSVRERADGVLSNLASVLTRARAEADALGRIMMWREYHDLIHRGRDLEKKLAMWGAAGIHAYYVENDSGRFGPFPLEQTIDFGSVSLAARSDGKDRIELVDARTTKVLAHSENGLATLDLAGASGNDRYPTTFQLTDRTDDLAVQLDFLIRQTGDHLSDLLPGAATAPSWCGKLLAVLSRTEVSRAIGEDHRRASERWRQLLEDVEQLAPLKARIETWHLIHRLAEAVPRIVRTLNEERSKLRASTNALEEIVARCGRDVETDRLVIPSNLVRRYEEQTRFRDRARREVARIEAYLKELAGQANIRLASSAMIGSNNAPQLAALPPLPQDFTAAIATMDDAALGQQIALLEQVLGLKLQEPEQSGSERLET